MLIAVPVFVHALAICKCACNIHAVLVCCGRNCCCHCNCCCFFKLTEIVIIWCANFMRYTARCVCFIATGMGTTAGVTLNNYGDCGRTARYFTHTVGRSIIDSEFKHVHSSLRLTIVHSVAKFFFLIPFPLLYVTTAMPSICHIYRRQMTT